VVDTAITGDSGESGEPIEQEGSNLFARLVAKGGGPI
jgi:hypothetical protein